MKKKTAKFIGNWSKNEAHYVLVKIKTAKISQSQVFMISRQKIPAKMSSYTVRPSVWTRVQGVAKPTSHCVCSLREAYRQCASEKERENLLSDIRAGPSKRSVYIHRRLYSSCECTVRTCAPSGSLELLSAAWSVPSTGKDSEQKFHTQFLFLHHRYYFISYVLCLSLSNPKSP